VHLWIRRGTKKKRLTPSKEKLDCATPLGRQAKSLTPSPELRSCSQGHRPQGKKGGENEEREELSLEESLLHLGKKVKERQSTHHGDGREAT